MRILIAIAALALLAGCGATNNIGQLATEQQYAGITKLTITCHDPEKLPPEVLKIQKDSKVLCVLDKAVAESGKDYENVNVVASLAEGKVSFKAGKAVGSNAVAIRSAVEQAIAESGNDALKAVGPAITESIVQGVVKALAGGL